MCFHSCRFLILILRGMGWYGQIIPTKLAIPSELNGTDATQPMQSVIVTLSPVVPPIMAATIMTTGVTMSQSTRCFARRSLVNIASSPIAAKTLDESGAHSFVAGTSAIIQVASTMGKKNAP
ncbi:unannotated protein [freshwater metagenome]|uniref:Unannotated protein n=1 Tax=freshwater metagenome TaxID=449393 RepID=A0A6J7APU9_9ZZZZ